MPTTAELALQLKNDIYEVYEAGKKVGGNFDEAYQQGYQKGYEDASNYNPLENATTLANVYKNSVFPENTKLVLNIPNVSSCAAAFNAASGITHVTLKGGAPIASAGLNSTFINCLDLLYVNIEQLNISTTSLSSTFNGCSNLKEIIGEIDVSTIRSAMTATFTGCLSLEYVRFKEASIKYAISFADCPSLTKESIDSIIAGLGTISTAHTLTLNENIVLTEEQLAILNTKTNWTISQVAASSLEEQ